VGKVWDGIQEPLMTKDEYSKIQKILAEKSRLHRRKNEYLFSILAECPGCGGLLSGDLQKGTKYYRCSRAKGKNATCTHTEHIREDDLEKQLQEDLLKIRLPKKLIDWALKYLRQVYIDFFQKARNLNTEYEIAEPLDKKILLQSAGARFIRKNGKMTIKLEEPYSLLLPLGEFRKSSEPLATRFKKPQNRSSEADYSKWLLILDKFGTKYRSEILHLYSECRRFSFGGKMHLKDVNEKNAITSTTEGSSYCFA
jgi:hypothetical protein